MTYTDSLTGSDVSGTSNTSLSPSDPAGLVAWLRALPVGAVVLDTYDDAWQVRQTSGGQPYIRCITGGKSGYLGSDHETREMTDWAPYRLIWPSGGGDLASAGPTNRSAQTHAHNPLTRHTD